jgi:hypothetical protein
MVNDTSARREADAPFPHLVCGFVILTVLGRDAEEVFFEDNPNVTNSLVKLLPSHQNERNT